MSPLAKTFALVTLASLAASASIGCAASDEEDDVDAVEDQLTGSYAIATCTTGDPRYETADTLKLEATFDKGRLTSLSSASTDYRGEVRLTPRGLQRLRRDGRMWTVAYGSGTAQLIGARRASPISAIVIDPAAGQVRLTQAADGTGEILETHTNCRFQNIGQLKEFGAPLVKRGLFELAACNENGRLDVVAEQREGSWDVVAVKGDLRQNPAGNNSVTAVFDVDAEPGPLRDGFLSYRPSGGSRQPVAVEHAGVRKVRGTFSQLFLSPSRSSVTVEYTGPDGQKSTVEASGCTFKNLSLVRN
jgi:hypothetical protein